MMMMMTIAWTRPGVPGWNVATVSARRLFLMTE